MTPDYGGFGFGARLRLTKGKGRPDHGRILSTCAPNASRGARSQSQSLGSFLGDFSRRADGREEACA